MISSLAANDSRFTVTICVEDDGELLAGSFGILNRETSTTGVRFVATPPSVDVVVGFTVEFVVVVGGVLDVDD